jgi:hypothetical protein
VIRTPTTLYVLATTGAILATPSQARETHLLMTCYETSSNTGHVGIARYYMDEMGVSLGGTKIRFRILRNSAQQLIFASTYGDSLGAPTNAGALIVVVDKPTGRMRRIVVETAKDNSSVVGNCQFGGEAEILTG